MTLTVDQLRNQLREIEAELAAANEKVLRATVERERLQRAFDGCNALIEHLTAGQDGLDAPDGSQVEDSSDEQGEPATKSELIRRAIRDRGQSGATALDIWRALAPSTKMHRNYLYAVLKRLKARGIIRESAGRYFAS